MECLVTKLKGVVNDDSLLGLNELRLTVQHVTGREGIQLAVTEPITVKSLKGGMISLNSTINFTQSVTITNIKSPTNIYFQNIGETVISVSNKHSLKSIRLTSDNSYFKDFNLDDLKYCENLSEINVLVDGGACGDIGSLRNIPLGTLSLWNKQSNTSKIYGDASFISNVRLVSLMNVGSRNLGGTISKINYYLNMTNKESNVYVNIASENDISAECIRITFDNVSAFNLDWLQKTAIKDFSTLSTIYEVEKDLHFTGNICPVAKSKNISGSIFLKQAQGTDVQTLNDLPDSVTLFTTQSQVGAPSKDILPVSWDSNSSRSNGLALEGVHFKTGTAQFIKDISGCTFAGSGSAKRIEISLADDLTSSAAAGDSALQTAISALQGKNVTVSIGYSNTAVNGIALMRFKEASKYGIVYKGKELIIEPADTSRTLIAPANDCTYKEFAMKEEAKAFISSNGLVKAESK